MWFFKMDILHSRMTSSILDTRRKTARLLPTFHKSSLLSTIKLLLLWKKCHMWHSMIQCTRHVQVTSTILRVKQICVSWPCLLAEILRVIAATVRKKDTRLHVDQKAMLQESNGTRKQKKRVKSSNCNKFIWPWAKDCPQERKRKHPTIRKKQKCLWYCVSKTANFHSAT